MINVGLTYGGKQYKALSDATDTTTGVKPILLPIPAGEGSTEVMFTGFCRDMYIQVNTSSFETGDSLSFVVEGSLDGINWDNLSATNAINTITTNRATLLYFRDACPGYVRVRTTNRTLASGSSAGYEIMAFFAIAS